MASISATRRVLHPHILLPLLALAALLVAACGGGGDDAEATTTPTPTPTPTEAPSEVEQQLQEGGFQEIAAVVTVIEQGDPDALSDLLELSSRPCSAALDPGAEPGCNYEVVSSPSGNVRRYLESEGTLVEVFPFAACNLEWRRPDQLGDVVDWVDGADPEVYAIFEAPIDTQLPGEYVSVFASDSRQFALGVYTRGDRVTALVQGCSPGAASLVPVDQESFVLAPPAPEVPDVVPGAENARIITDNLNVRLGPGLDYSVVGQLNTGAEIQVIGRSVDGEWLAVGGAGWVFWNPEWIELGVTMPSLAALHAASTLGTIGELHPEGTHLGVASVDAVIDAVTQGDASAIDALINYARVPCTNGFPGPGCGALAPGTPTDAISHIGCSEELLSRPTGLGQRILSRPEGGSATDRLRLYLVVETPDDAQAAYAVLFAFDSDPAHGRLVFVGRNGGIVRAATGCGGEAPVWLLRLVEGSAVAVLLPPRPAALDPSPQ